MTRQIVNCEQCVEFSLELLELEHRVRRRARGAVDGGASALGPIEGMGKGRDLRGEIRDSLVLFGARHACALGALSAWRIRSRARVIRPNATPSAPGGWELLAHVRRVMCTRPQVAYAVRCLPLIDQLELTLELLKQWQESEPELPSNVILFRPRRSH
jgi:hypothetical protein